MKICKRFFLCFFSIVMAFLLCMPVSAAKSGSEIIQQIKDTYAEARRQYGGSFEGYCNQYVDYQLKILGIDNSMIHYNGNGYWDYYKGKSTTSGGYSIHAYSASNYNIKQGLNAITENGTKNAYNIMVGFQGGYDGGVYGHVMFIHAVMGGKVYFSESYGCNYDGTYYPEGSPTVISIDTFHNFYTNHYGFEGMIHFTQTEPEYTGIISFSTDYVSLYTNEAESIAVTCSGQLPPSYYVSYSMDDSSIADLSWGSWDGNSIPLTITGKGEGWTEVIIKLINSADSNQILATSYFTIWVRDEHATIYGIPSAIDVLTGSSYALPFTCRSDTHNPLSYRWETSDSRIFSVSRSWWGEQEDDQHSIGLFAKIPGTAYLTVYVEDSVTGHIWDTRIVEVNSNYNYKIVPEQFFFINHGPSSSQLMDMTDKLVIGYRGNENDPRYVWYAEKQTDGAYLLINEYAQAYLSLDTNNDIVTKAYRASGSAGDYQKWRFSGEESHPGYYWIVNDADPACRIAINSINDGDRLIVSSEADPDGMTQLFGITQAVDSSNHIYARPSKPTAPSVTYRRVGSQVIVSWTESPVSSSWDERGYCIKVFDGDGFLLNTRLTDNLTYSFEPSNNNYIVTVQAVNEKYDWNLVNFAISDISSVIIPLSHVNPFVDVAEGKYYYGPVLWAYYHDPQITGGTDATHFSPGKNCTREQIVSFLWKAYGAEEPAMTFNPFSDVKESKYYYKAVLWAVQNGITGGSGDGKFGVGKACTREQAVSFLWKAAGAPEPKGTDCPFEDVKPGKYYYKAVLWAVENGVTGGTSTTKFGVGKVCTRGQIVTFLYKALGENG